MGYQQRRQRGPYFYRKRMFGTAPGFVSDLSFSPRQFLLWKPEQELMTKGFRNLVLPMLTQITGREEYHHHIYEVTDKETFEFFERQMRRMHQKADARQVIHMLQRQLFEKIGYFSDDFANFARVSDTVWIMIKPVRHWDKDRRRMYRWMLHAFDVSDPEFVKDNDKRFLFPGQRLICGQGPTEGPT